MAGLMDEFDSIYGSAVEQPAAAAVVEAPAGSLEEVVEEYSEETIDDELAAAERQIAKATYYKAIIRQGIIEEDGTELANEVNNEAKLWARYMTMRLLNRRMPEQAHAAPEAQFSEPEVHALKRLAAIALAKSGEAPAPAPMVKTIQSAPTPAVKKVASQEPRPAVRAQAPAKQQPAAKKPATKAAPAKKPAPAAKAQPKRTAGQPFEAPIKDGELDDDSIPSNEVFIDPRDGKKYKFVDNRMYDPDIEGSKPRAKLCVENQAVRGINPLPMPSARAMEAISFQQASETIEAGATAGAVPTDNGTAGVAMFGLAAQASLRKE